MDTMTTAREPDDDDDLIAELPDLGDLGEDELVGADELDLEDGAENTQDEDVGLDDSTGLDDAASIQSLDLHALELPPEDKVTDEEGVDLIPVEGLDGDDEYGWSDTGKAQDEPWDPRDVDIPELLPIGGEDRGEEGVDESMELGGASGDEVPHLPPMRDRLGDGGDEDEDAEDLAIGEDAMIEEAELSYDEERRQMGRTLPPRLDAPACVVDHLGPSSAIFAFTHGPPVLAAGAGLYRVADRCERVDASGLEDLDVIAVAVDPHDPRRVVVGTRLAGALRSMDGGASFVAANSWASEGRDVTQAFALRLETPSRVWGRTSGGALFRSDDFGASWVGPLILKPVVALAMPEDGGVVALCAGRDAPPQIARSEDGGQRWTAVDGPLVGAGELSLAAFRDVVALSADEDPSGPYLSNDRGKTWARMPGLPPTGAMAFAWEPGGLTMYAAHFFDGEDRGVVVRHRPGGSEGAVVLDVAYEAGRRAIAPKGDPEGDHRVYALEARREGERTILFVATGAGLFRVSIDPDRAP